MKTSLLLVIITWCLAGTEAQSCAKPNIQRKQIFIYRTTPLIKVKVFACLFIDRSPSNNYYDFTDKCIIGSKTKVFDDKYGDVQYVGSANSKVQINHYETDADPLVNKIWLKSGTSCRYDAGFCFDPKQSENYAVTWSVQRISPEQCPQDLNKIQQIFYGYIDFWEFPAEQRKYIFYSVPLQNKALALSLSNTSICHNKEVWHDEETGYIISTKSLLRSVRPTPRLNEKMFPPLKSKAVVSDFILKDCSLKTQNLNFDNKIDADYLIDLNNLNLILKLYQHKIDNNKKLIDDLKNKIGQGNDRDRSVISETEFKNVKDSINDILRIINKLSSKVQLQKDAQLDSVSQINQVLSDVKGLRDRIQTLEANVRKLENKLDTEIKKAKPLIKQQIIDELTPLIKSINQSTISCSTDVKQLKYDIDRPLDDLGTKIDILSNTINKTVESHLNQRLPNIADNVKLALEPSIIMAQQKSNDCLNKLFDLQHGVDKTVHRIETELQTCTTEQKRANDDFNNLNNTIQSRLTNTESDVKNLFDLVQGYKDTTEMFTDKKIGDIVKNVSDTYQILDSNLKRAVADQLQPEIQSFQAKIDQCSTDVSTLRTDTNKRVDSLDREISRRDGDVSRELDTLKKSLTDKIDLTDSKLEVLADQNKNDRILVDRKFDQTAQDISSIKNDVKNVATAVKNDVFNRINDALDPAKINENISKELDEVKRLLANEINTSSNKITNLESEIESCKQLTITKDKANEDKINDLQKQLNSVRSSVNRLESSTKGKSADKINAAFNQCLQDVQQLKHELDKLKNNLQATVKKIINDENEAQRIIY